MAPTLLIRTEAIKIRKARKADLPVLVDFMVKLADHVAGGPARTIKRAERKKLKELLAAALEDDDKLVVVAQAPDNTLVAMGDIHIWRSQAIWEQLDGLEYRSGIIDDIWVEPEYRKQGVFRAMLRELVAFAEGHGANELILEYSIANKEAEAAWSRLGFKPTGVRAAAFTETVRQRLLEPE